MSRKSLLYPAVKSTGYFLAIVALLSIGACSREDSVSNRADVGVAAFLEDPDPCTQVIEICGHNIDVNQCVVPYTLIFGGVNQNGVPDAHQKCEFNVRIVDEFGNGVPGL